MRLSTSSIALALILGQASFGSEGDNAASRYKSLVSGEDIKDLVNVIASVLVSCAGEAVTNPANVSSAKEELYSYAEGIADIAVQKVLTLALKRDFPNACHVLPGNILEDIEESYDQSRPCINWISNPFSGEKTCIEHETRQSPIYRYYWPKYFVEVSGKGNDPHPAFAFKNGLYAANRKLANAMAGWVDVKGPYALLAKVVGTSTLIRAGTNLAFGGGSGGGIDFTPTPEDLTNASKTAVLTPFEKLRIRANSEPTAPSYEVNIWPVALSEPIAKHLTVCGAGGFQWKIPGVPMTCPVAMARDAWPYWDTGFLDYLNPKSIRGIAAAANPVQCLADNVASLAWDSYAAKDASDALATPDGAKRRDKSLLDLPASFRGIGMCSFPILGDAEAIANQMISTVKGPFSGPWCSIWGPVVPRNSTAVYQTDYSYPNAALKFKLLAHDVFGLPRGKKERWALAYPWEGDTSSSLEGVLGGLKGVFSAMGIENIPGLSSLASAAGRSHMLMPPGDPRLIDASYDPALLASDAQNLARELVYLASLNKAASSAEKAAYASLSGQYEVGPADVNSLLEEHEGERRQAIEEAARVGEEPVYEERIYCHVSKEGDGTVIGSSHYRFEVGEFGTLAFEPMGSLEQCHQAIEGRCLDYSVLRQRCIRRQDIRYITLVRQEVVGYRSRQNPTRKKPGQIALKEQSRYKTPGTHQIHYWFGQTLDDLGEEDTRDYTAKPDRENPEASIGNNTLENATAGREAAVAATVATWVGAEIARAKYEEMLGRSLLPGKKRVYTVYEQIECTPGHYRKRRAGVWAWEQCDKAVHYEIRKWFQTKLLRKVCDSVFMDPLGKPFR